MRDILFRGKRIDNGEWIEGSFLLDGEAFKTNPQHPFSKHYIVPETDIDNIITKLNGSAYLLKTKAYHIFPETVEQYTGLTDKKGTKIFEGDIVEVFYDTQYVGVAAERIGNFEVVFDDGCFMKKKIHGVGLFHFIGSDVCKIIGNIHDNPELLKGGADK